MQSCSECSGLSSHTADSSSMSLGVGVVRPERHHGSLPYDALDSGALVDTQHESCILIRQKLLTFGPPRRTNNLGNLAASRVASLLGTGTAGEYSRILPVRGTRKPVEDPEFVNSRRCSVDREGCLLNRRCVTVHPPAPLRTTSPACNINKRPKMCPSHRCAGLV